MTVNTEVIEQWAEALESGEFPQGNGALRNYDDNYCCLGVLCELAVKAGVIEPAKNQHQAMAYAYGPEHDDCVLPNEVRDWAGLEQPDPVLRYVEAGFTRESSCVHENDAMGRDFTVIAGMIRETYLEPA